MSWFFVFKVHNGIFTLSFDIIIHFTQFSSHSQKSNVLKILVHH